MSEERTHPEAVEAADASELHDDELDAMSGGGVSATSMSAVTEKSGHQIVPMAVNVCIMPVVDDRIPAPYPTGASATAAGQKSGVKPAGSAYPKS